jgi:Fe-S oxidoreductase
VVFNQMYIYDPPKPWRKGTYGVYEIPRDVVKAVPGVRLVEMKRIKEYAWCCGAGGGVIDAYPDFAIWTALERIEEAKSTGAEAMVTACPWCKRNFLDALRESGDKLKILDVIELIELSI